MKPKYAVLFFGLLNSFERIYGAETETPSVVSALKIMGADFDVFVDTSPLAFIKVNNKHPGEDNELGSRTLIDRVPAGGDRDYLVLHHAREEINWTLYRCLGTHVVHVHMTEPDPTTWKGKFYMSNMIRTFLMRKKRLVHTAIDHAVKNGFEYSGFFLVRPDSSIRKRGQKMALASVGEVAVCLQNDLRELESQGLLGVDYGGFSPKTGDAGLRLLKNDLMVGSPAQMVKAVSLIDLVEKERAYVPKTWSSAYRCAGCMSLFRSLLDECSVCGTKGEGTNVRDWPEFRTSEHINNTGVGIYPLSVTGSVIR